MYSTDEMKQLLKSRLGKKRFSHSINVADECRRLAEIHGCDPQKAYTAGLLHDICKELPREEQLEMVIKSGCTDEAELNSPPLWHAIAGAYYVGHELGIDDTDIISAIRYHTAAGENMSLLAEILYLADLTSKDRTYKDVDRFRRLASSSLRTAMLEALRFAIPDIIKKHGFFPLHTIKAYNFYQTLECSAVNAEDKDDVREKRGRQSK